MNDIVAPDDRHERYVSLGYCPAISWCKSWCCQQDGHGGQHFSLRLMPDGSFVIGIRWD